MPDRAQHDTEVLTAGGHDATLADQAEYWNQWNTLFIDNARAQSSQRQSEVVVEWLQGAGRRGVSILDVGCGSGWMSSRLSEFGKVTAIDLSAGVLQVAQSKFPEVQFLAGDFMSLPIGYASADVIVTLEVLAHVADQAAFVARLAQCLKPGGRLMLSTQNRFVFERIEDVSPLKPGLIRQWVDVPTLRRLLESEFSIDTLITVVPRGHRGVLRLINSPKLNGMLGHLLGDSRVLRFKERLGFGQTIMVLATRRAG